MVSLFSDRIPWTMLSQIVWKRPSSHSRWQRQAVSPASPARRPAEVAAASSSTRSAARSVPASRKHGAPDLARLRHVWYRTAVARDSVHDAYYFVRTGEWVEPKCEDPVCAFCRDRPERHPAAHRGEVPGWLAKPASEASPLR